MNTFCFEGVQLGNHPTLHRREQRPRTVGGSSMSEKVKEIENNLGFKKDIF